MFEKVKAFFKRNYDAILWCITVASLGVAFLTTIWAITMTTISNDLTEVVQMRETEKKELERYNTFLRLNNRNLIDLYQDVVPREDHESMIDYYESKLEECKCEQ